MLFHKICIDCHVLFKAVILATFPALLIFWKRIRQHLIMLGLIFTLIVSISVASCNVFSAIPKQPHSDDDLRSLLSRQATVVRDESVQRWSDYGAPRPGIVVNVATEEDVVSTVRSSPPFIVLR